ncbi:hypothetical protein PVAP13_2NG067500 [Panicum virgatum]|uniref:F-box domain-containing protein n=1 Tax=Panicum virgatum TaxID=38727 RepID=A0A8T0VFV4_PANVG|nr:hypothetical protein PVAP13_2NG067500 [Panicum virgatum]
MYFSSLSCASALFSASPPRLHLLSLGLRSQRYGVVPRRGYGGGRPPRRRRRGDPLPPSRVPVRSIHRFKCVSKPWRNLIAAPLHRKRLPQTLEGFSSAMYPDSIGASSACRGDPRLPLTLLLLPDEAARDREHQALGFLQWVPPLRARSESGHGTSLRRLQPRH